MSSIVFYFIAKKERKNSRKKPTCLVIVDPLLSLTLFFLVTMLCCCHSCWLHVPGNQPCTQLKWSLYKTPCTLFFRLAHMFKLIMKLSKDNLQDGVKHNVKNVGKSKTSEHLVLFDNESSFYKGYAALHINGSLTEAYSYNEHILRLVCIFQRRTVEGVRKIAASSDPLQYLFGFVRQMDPLASMIVDNETTRKWYRFRGIPGRPILPVFRERLNNVLDWISKCENYWLIFEIVLMAQSTLINHSVLNIYICT